MKVVYRLVAAVLLLTFVLAVSAKPEASRNFAVHLDGESEVPAVETKAQGQVIFKLSKDGLELSYKLIVANIENLFVSHIHLGAVDAVGPPVVFLYDPAPIEGRFDGVLAEGTIEAADLVGPLSGQSLSALIDAMRAGNTYVNVHTSQNPAGEIRGQIG